MTIEQNAKNECRESKRRRQLVLIDTIMSFKSKSTIEYMYWYDRLQPIFFSETRYLVDPCQ